MRIRPASRNSRSVALVIGTYSLTLSFTRRVAHSRMEVAAWQEDAVAPNLGDHRIIVVPLRGDDSVVEAALLTLTRHRTVELLQEVDLALDVDEELARQVAAEAIAHDDALDDHVA